MQLQNQIVEFFRSLTFRKASRYVFVGGKWFVLLFFVSTIYYTLCFSFLPPPLTPLMVKRHFELKNQKKNIPFRHTWVPIYKISANIVQAVVASEDNRFTSHFGLDLGAIEKARKHNERHRRKHGASTISQQTAKNVFLWPARSYLRKGFEVYFTLLIETCWSKKRIITVYLNMIEMGPGIYGVEAASQYYFHKPAAKLTRSEAALIAACLPNPLKRNPAAPSGYVLKRKQEIQSLMGKIGKVEL